MPPNLALGAVIVVALLHVGFMVLEATQWSSPLGQKLLRLSEGAARETAKVGVNMGIYNGFLGLALLWATFSLDARSAHSVQCVLLGFIAFAGIVGAVTIKSPGIFCFQTLPALVALAMICTGQPSPGPAGHAGGEVPKLERRVLALGTVEAHRRGAGSPPSVGWTRVDRRSAERERGDETK